MCIIVYKPANKNVIRKFLRNCFINNKEGAGFMWAHKGRLYIEKGFFAFRKFYKRFRQVEKRFKDSDFIIHFRIGTSGATGKINCHPFRVTQNIGFCHNGILFDFSNHKSNICDSLAFSHKVLAPLGNDIFNEGVIKLLDGYAKANVSKFAFMNNKGEVVLSNKDDWEYEEGIWYSNSGYKWEFEYVVVNYGKNYYGGHDWERCDECFTYCDSDNIFYIGGKNICTDCLKVKHKNSSVNGKVKENEQLKVIV